LDLDGVRERIERALSEGTGGPAQVSGLRPLLGGACQDNLRVDAVLEAGPLTGAQALVLRSDAPRSLPDSIDRAAELQVIEAAVAAGVSTPPARWLSEGVVREGANAYFLEWREGEAIGKRVVTRPELAAARRALPGQLAAELAKVHSITPASAPQLAAVLGDRPEDPARSVLARARLSLDRASEQRPALEYAMGWLNEHQPPVREVTLLHGDFRTGNFLVGPEGLVAVLDWEFAHWGSPAEDVAWLCVRDWRFGQLKKAAGGIATRAEFYAAYAEASGRTLDPSEVHFWEVLGNVRWAAGCLCQGRRYTSGEQRDLELIAIARRAGEMEYEALRLIERGAP
jgi:aminoglycoside phosphotransferase (APT) family kinase protein